MKREVCNCKSLCCPLVEQRLAVRLLHESEPFGVYKNVYLEFDCFVYICHHMSKHQRGRKKGRESVTLTNTEKKKCNVGNQLAG